LTGFWKKIVLDIIRIGWILSFLFAIAKFIWMGWFRQLFKYFQPIVWISEVFRSYAVEGWIGYTHVVWIRQNVTHTTISIF